MCVALSLRTVGVRTNLLHEPDGSKTLACFDQDFPELSSVIQFLQPDIDAMLDGADVVLMHEWNDPALIAAVGARRRQGGRFLLLFHDTHHRAVTDPRAIGALDLDGYDGVLAFGKTLADVYRRNGWGTRAFVWHEAADTRCSVRRRKPQHVQGAVWIGNWGDDERSEELGSYLLDPTNALNLPLDIYGVRYPAGALTALQDARARYRGWLPNARAPGGVRRHIMTVHVPRRAYATKLPGIPTIRVFEALACGIPLICAPWEDSESLFHTGIDYISAPTPEAMRTEMARLQADADMRQSRSDKAGSGPSALGIAAPTGSVEAYGHPDPIGRRRSGGRSMIRVAFYGSSLLSSYWNGAATYYRGLLAALAPLGYAITFFEPDAYDRQSHRDIEPPSWAQVQIYPATRAAVCDVVAKAAEADIVIKASGVGVFDAELLAGAMKRARLDALRVFWDVDAPATLAEIRADAAHPLRRILPNLDLVLTYGGGDRVVTAYRGFDAPVCQPIYNALDPSTHFPVPSDPSLYGRPVVPGKPHAGSRGEGRAVLFLPGRVLAGPAPLLGGNGWDDKSMPPNVRRIGHVRTERHNAFNVSALAVLNVARDSMATIGFSPATRVFEAAGAGACLITDAWEGLEQFLTPGTEVLVARDGRDVVEHIEALQPKNARAIGAAARARVLAEHTYDRRAREVDGLFRATLAQRRG